MNRKSLEALSLDELWALHEEINAILTEKINLEKSELENRLLRLSRGLGRENSERGSAKQGARRPYPRVLPKFRNPAQPSETWSGRGKMPKWLTSELRSGKGLDEFRIRA
jgi:DNA-binding protein H-NS